MVALNLGIGYTPQNAWVTARRFNLPMKQWEAGSALEGLMPPPLEETPHGSYVFLRLVIPSVAREQVRAGFAAVVNQFQAIKGDEPLEVWLEGQADGSYWLLVGGEERSPLPWADILAWAGAVLAVLVVGGLLAAAFFALMPGGLPALGWILTTPAGWALLGIGGLFLLPWMFGGGGKARAQSWGTYMEMRVEPHVREFFAAPEPVAAPEPAIGRRMLKRQKGGIFMRRSRRFQVDREPAAMDAGNVNTSEGYVNPTRGRRP